MPQHNRRDWITDYGNMPTGPSVAVLVAMHRRIHDRIVNETRRDKAWELLVLLLSVVTSGALWVLIVQSNEEIAAWAGAISGTLVTAVTLYQHTIGPRANLGRYNPFFSEFGQRLADVRTAPDSFTWHLFKDLESQYVKLGFGRPSDDEIRTARWS